MKAIILAAGYATRLYPLTEHKPKCLLPVGGTTILDILCQKLDKLESLEEILIVTNARFYDQMCAWKDRSGFRHPVKVINDGTTSNDNRLGAIGDLGFTLKKTGLGSDILMLASDNLFDSEFDGFVRASSARPDGVTIGLYNIGDPSLASKKYGVIEVDGSWKVTGMEEKPEHPKSSLIGMGIYYFPKGTLSYVGQYLADPEAKDAPGFYIRWLWPRLGIFGFLFKGLWYDIGDLRSLQEADDFLSERKKGK